MQINSDTSKYKPCPKCGLSNNPIKEQTVEFNSNIIQKSTSLTCMVCNENEFTNELLFTTGLKFDA